jgi:probable O-glycosylation ligase (exosortase A-associated)
MTPLRDIVVITVVVVSLPFCFWRPFYGVILWTVLSFLNPQQLSWGIARQFPLSLAVAVPTIAGGLVFSQFWNALRRDVLLIIALWAWFSLTTLHTAFTPAFQHFSADTWFRWGFISRILVMTIATIGAVDTWKRFRCLLLAVAGVFGFFVLKAFPWMLLTLGSFRLYGPQGTMIADNNDFGLALVMTLPLYYFLAKTEIDLRLKWLLGCLFVITIPAIAITYSRGALLGLATVLVMMVLRTRRRLVLVSVLLLTGPAALFLAPEKWQQRMDFTRESAVFDASALSRLNSWAYSRNLALDYPLTGGGFEAFTQPLFDKYAPNPLDVHGPHSIYFGVLAEHGFPGLLLYLVFIGACFVRLSRSVRLARRCRNAAAEDYAGMLWMSLCGFLACGAFLGRAYFDYFFLIAACTIILQRLCLADYTACDSSDTMTDETDEVRA